MSKHINSTLGVAITVGGDCSAEIFISKGVFNINGLLNADEIDIRIYHNCKVKEIGGREITIKEGRTSKIIKTLKSLFVPLSSIK